MLLRLNSINDLFRAQQAIEGQLYRMHPIRTNLFFGNLKYQDGKFTEIMDTQSGRTKHMLDSSRQQAAMLFEKAASGANVNRGPRNTPPFDPEPPAEMLGSRFQGSEYESSQDLERALDYLEEAARVKGAENDLLYQDVQEELSRESKDPAERNSNDLPQQKV